MSSRFVSEINVTPFVDVMLVMLIIFMVATPMMSSGLDVDLPQTKQVESLPTESDHMVLTVRRDGALFLDEYRVDNLDQLEGYLKSLVKDNLKEGVIVSALEGIFIALFLNHLLCSILLIDGIHLSTSNLCICCSNLCFSRRSVPIGPKCSQWSCRENGCLGIHCQSHSGYCNKSKNFLHTLKMFCLKC